MFIICTNIMSSLDYTSVNPWMPNLRPRNLDTSGVRVSPKPKIHRIMRITEQAEGSRGEAMKLLNEQRRLQRNHWKKLSTYAIFHKEWSNIQKNAKKCPRTLCPLKTETISPWLLTFRIATFDSVK